MAVVAYAPIESSQLGFYVIPGFTRYGASRDGRIINIRTGHLKRFYPIRGYAATTVMCDVEGVMKWVFVHRLVARAGSIGQLAEMIPVKFATIAYALRTGRQYPCFGYLFKLESDPTPWIH